MKPQDISIKTLILLLLVFGTLQQVFTQNSYQRQLKYWYLRDRLRYFIAQNSNPESEDGSYMVITARNRSGDGDPYSDRADYGQESSLFGKYLGMLATEYCLLTRSGNVQEAGKTNIELLNALKAHRRRDMCEHFFGYPDLPNGYFVRCDVPKNLNPGGPEYQNPLIDAHPELNTYTGFLIDDDPLLDPNSSTVDIRKVSGMTDVEQAYEQMSQDEAIFTLEGLALAFHFGSSEVKEFARELALWILFHCYGNGSWLIMGFGGVTPVPTGYDCNSFSYGYSAVEQYFLGTPLPPNYLTWWEWFMILSQGSGDPSNNHMIASLAAIGNAFGPNTEAAIFNNCDDEGWQTYYLWLRKALWDDPNDYIDVGNVENQLDDAPCEGPWRTSDNVHGGYGWCTSDRWCHDHTYLCGTGTDAFNGIFSGLDYMLLLNLYYISNCSYCSPYINRDEAICDKSWPNGNEGSILQPLSINTFRSITSTESVDKTPIPGEVHYYAGEYVYLKPGFEVLEGARFSAQIQFLEYCQESSDKSLSENFFTARGNTELKATRTNNDVIPSSLETNRNDSCIDSNSDFLLYPNPANGLIQIKTTNPACYQIQIHSMDGQLVYNELIELTTLYSINIENMNKGVYIIKFISGNQVITKEFIKM